MTEAELEKIDIAKLDLHGDTGYIFNVTLSYPEELHSVHEEFPFAVEKMTINESMLSPFAAECHLSQKGVKSYRSEKLVASFGDKVEYVTHYAALQQFLSKGLKLEKIHSGISFTQGEILKPYIDDLTFKRKNARNNFEKNLYKYMINSVYGE